MVGSRWIRSALRALPLAGLALASPALAQEPARTLTLEDAIALARLHNPGYLSQANDEADAEWGVREAYGSLLPGASASTGFQYQAAGSQRFGVFTSEDIGFSETPAYYFSDYSIGLHYRLNGATLARIGQEKANRTAARAFTEAAGFTLSAAVTRQYMAARRAADNVELAERKLARADENLRLARARVEVGAAIPLEQTQFEVERGRAEVALLQARNARATERLRLEQVLGTELEDDVALTSEFRVFEPQWTEAELVQRAIASHPQLQALRAAEDAGEAAVKMARSGYLPTLDVSAGWSGYSREASNGSYLIDQARQNLEQQRQQCETVNFIITRLTEPLPAQDCAAMRLTPEQEAQILAENNAFPFDFTKQPFTVAARVSLPIFTGFARQRQVERARVLADDARYSLRAEELQLRTDVAAAYRNLETAHQTVQLETRNRELAEAQLRLARERYRVGQTSFLELSEAETLLATAETAYLAAFYGFHEALAALEAAVGTPLTTGEDAR